MEKSIVTVQYLYNGVINENENESGVLIGNKVLVAGNGEMGLYNAQATAKPGVYMVDLDNDGCDFLHSHPTLILDMIIA
jgi:hypothetical protein